MEEFGGITTAPNDPNHAQQVIDHIAHLDEEQLEFITHELMAWMGYPVPPDADRTRQ